MLTFTRTEDSGSALPKISFFEVYSLRSSAFITLSPATAKIIGASGGEVSGNVEKDCKIS